ncbi:phosphoribosylformylglycinamidine synthase [Helicobacter monodelphidis]|uniref:phosphoribosylformylglycinamidine synthase subunit PurS n=1 Tax=Helicobacter sp. 15-1451 TaxID=2004995 RepID=UPI000DCF61FC|nr:phosphoribosylformylglycinamidine synthase subunit PurS [Helicobacter sp. 15-1451]RAX56882.1 phosphoribosylformylglycinamidine synthase [Helicobacter sp. 15-1451]
MKARVFITLKEGVLDPQGKATKQALHALHFQNITDVRMGKMFIVDIDETDKERVKQELSKACDLLLSNNVIEQYEIEL